LILAVRTPHLAPLNNVGKTVKAPNINLMIASKHWHHPQTPLVAEDNDRIRDQVGMQAGNNLNNPDTFGVMRPCDRPSSDASVAQASDLSRLLW
jgi:hypothetical protein